MVVLGFPIGRPCTSCTGPWILERSRQRSMARASRNPFRPEMGTKVKWQRKNEHRQASLQQLQHELLRAIHPADHAVHGHGYGSY